MPAFKPGTAVHTDIKKTNAALDGLNLESGPEVHVLGLWKDFTNPDGSPKAAACSDGHLHLGDAGYGIYASKLTPVESGILANVKEPAAVHWPVQVHRIPAYRGRARPPRGCREAMRRGYLDIAPCSRVL